ERKGGTPRPPLYPKPSPAVLAVTLPGTSGIGPSVPANAEDPPPPRVAGFTGTTNAPAFTTCANVIAVFGRDSDASRSQAAVVCAFCALAATGMSIIRTNMLRMETPLLAIELEKHRSAGSSSKSRRGNVHCAPHSREVRPVLF